tara:strand:- start:562 stop:1575 length:1014 start_codon:yes stop_codon:yes gene_type:complete
MFLKLFYLTIINLASIYVFKYFAEYFGLIDTPNYRKKHKEPTPLIGGISIFFTLFLSIFFFEYSKILNIIIISSSVIFIIGLLDDMKNIGVIIRLVAQLIASLIVVFSGLYVINLGNFINFESINLEIFFILFTIFSVISLTNAFNFIDGMDGLAGGSFLVAIISILLFQFFGNGFKQIELLFLLIIIISIYLLFNLSFFSFKKIFLGDSGSLLLGFLMSWFLIYFTHPETRTFHPVLTIWCVTFPVFDTISVVFRRFISKKNIFLPDLFHMHHILNNFGFSKIFSVLIILFSGLLLSILGLLIYIFFGPLVSLLSYIFLSIIYIFVSFYLMKRGKN